MYTDQVKSESPLGGRRAQGAMPHADADTAKPGLSGFLVLLTAFAASSCTSPAPIYLDVVGESVVGDIRPADRTALAEGIYENVEEIEFDICVPDCTGMKCGDDGCGGSCGECPGDQDACVGGQCVCQPSCEGKKCGDDGCGESCGACNDGNPCTDDVCDLQTWICTYPANDAACDDGNPCTDPDECSAGACVGALMSVEELTDLGMLDQCLCAADEDCEPLEDGDLCNGTLFCDDSLIPPVCMVDPDTVVEVGEGDCDDGVDCTEDSCEAENGCVHFAVDASCDDDNVCTVDVCEPLSGCVHEFVSGPCGEFAICAGGQCVCEFLDCGEVCCPAGNTCVEEACCQPECEDKECGADGCGGNCGQCGELKICDVDGLCACESLGCGEACCAVGQVCFDETCCQPDCADKECGDDGCGGSCGVCEGKQDFCEDGACVCQPACDGKECGPDGCGGDCGQCPDLPWIACLDTGLCGDICLKFCEGRECGQSPECGIVCGECPKGAACNKYGQCVGKAPGGCFFGECGPNGMGGGCGICDEGLWCTNGICTEAYICIPECAGKQCGPDGCGGSCGECPPGIACTGSALCGGPCAQCPAPAECFDIDFSDGTLTGWSELENAYVVSSYGASEPLSGGWMLKTGPDGQADFQYCTGPGQYILSIVWQAYWQGYSVSGNGRDVYVQLAFNDHEPNPWNAIFLASGKDLAPKVWCGLDSPKCEGFDSWWLCDEYYHCVTGIPEMEDETWPNCAASICNGWQTEFDGWCPSYYACDPWEGGAWGEDCQWCGEHYLGLEGKYSDEFGHHTPWTETLAQGTTEMPSRLTVTAFGEDTVVLIDSIRLIDPDEFCSDRECGGQAVGLDCGTCPAGEECGLYGKCQPECQPECEGKECGWDGCGWWCGSCEGNDKCLDNWQCGICEPDCNGKECGSDGCKIPGSNKYGTCGKCEDCGEYCSEDGQCIADPCGEMECGESCGKDCGQCPDDEVCLLGFCCKPDCEGKPCGPDGCGGWCGFCPPGGACVAGECIPLSCGEKECGDNGYGASCGECEEKEECYVTICKKYEQECLSGYCIYYSGPSTPSCGGEKCNAGEICFDEQCCLPECAGKECGENGCGNLCGLCGCGRTCNDDGQCVFTACDGKECGNDLCGGLCGQCPEGQACHDGTCCTPECAGKECGSDGCGGDCGTCNDEDPTTFDICQQYTCAHPSVYCDEEAQCTDADDECTDDSCGEGLCVHSSQDKPGCCKEEMVLWDFEDGLPDYLEIENSEPEVGWRLGSESITETTHCLIYGAKVPGNHEGNTSGEILFPTITIRAESKAPRLEYEFKYKLDASDAHVFVVTDEVEDQLPGYLYNDGPQGKWGIRKFDLSSYKGQSIRIKFKVSTYSLHSSKRLYIDNIRIVQQCCDEDGECNDDNACTSDVCSGPSGFCHNDEIEGCCLDDAGCDDGDACTWDLCTLDHTCKYLPVCCAIDEQCTDNDGICTDDLCIEGQCEYIPTWAEGCCIKPVFYDDFSTDKGWEYGEFWERGEAMESDCADSYPDPALDYSNTSDNFVAGVQIGGCIEGMELPFSYLTSPVIPVGVQDSLFLTYAMWLNHKTNNVSLCTVEVFDGASWVNIWVGDDTDMTSMTQWQVALHDISPYANELMRVRFGFNLMYWMPVEISSWNLDDVRVLSSLSPGSNCCTWNGECGVFDQECVLGKCQ